MPLWAVPQPKLENGIEIRPWRSVGGRTFDPTREDDLAWLRAQYDEAQADMPQPPKLGWLTRLLLGLGVRLMTEDPTAAAFRERWNRPFDQVVAQVAAEGRIVRKYDPQVLADWPRLAELPTFPEFPAWTLEAEVDGEAINRIAAELDLPSYRFADELAPEEMRELASELAHCAGEFRAKTPELDQEGEASLRAVDTAVDWLRFWAERGHPSKGCRFIETPHGRIAIEVG
jgi:hypothetical protein